MNPRYYAAFAEYLTEVVRRYATDPAWNITFDVLAPVNEPNDGAWRQGGGQEGCNFSPADMAKLMPLVREALNAKSLRQTKLVGFDSWALTTARNLATYLDDKTIAQADQIHTHGYLMPYEPLPYWASEGTYSNIRKSAQQLGKDVVVSEWTFLRHAGSDLDLGLLMARTITESVNYMGASAFVYWQAIDKTPRFSLITVNWDMAQRNSYPHVVLKKFWVMKHFTSFAPPGSIPLLPGSSTGCEHCVTAFYNPKNASLALFITNQQGSSTDLRFSLDFTAQQPAVALVYRTSISESFAQVATVSIPRLRDFTITVPRRSLTTYVFMNVYK